MEFQNTDKSGHAANPHINRLLPFPGRASFLGSSNPSTGTHSLSQQSFTDSSRPISQQSMPFVPNANQPTTELLGTALTSSAGYKTARAVLPSGVFIALSSTSSGPLFEDTIIEMINTLRNSVDDTTEEFGSASPSDVENEEHGKSTGQLSNTSEEEDPDEDEDEKSKAKMEFGETLDQVVSKIFDEEQGPDPRVFKSCRLKVLGVLVSLLLLISCSITLTTFPVLTCQDANALCLAPVSIRLTDKTESAKSTMQTIREALKVLTYIVIDFGDTSGDSELMNNRMDEYYQSSVIDSFNVNTTYDLNIWGYCRTSDNGVRFCMKSYGFDMISVFVRDAGVQLGELTKTNVGIMGDSFAMLYELSIAGFSELLLREEGEGNGNGEYVDHAILLQKFSKGMGFMAMTQLVVNCVLLAGTALMLVLLFNSKLAPKHDGRIYALKKYIVVTLTLMSFVSVLSGFLVLSFTHQFYVKLSQLTTTVGIADVELNTGFYLLWVSLVVQIAVTTLVVYVANCFRKQLF